ncbi:MAG: carboxypeptidase-like regulatory domain-containing protein [Clostridia bacterium]
MKNRLHKYLLILSVCLLLLAALVGCSVRSEPFDDYIVKNPEQVGPEDGQETTTVTSVSFEEAQAAIVEAVENNANMVKSDGNSEWFIIDTQIDYDFIDYLTSPIYEIHISVIIKANINLINNAESEIFFEFRDRSLPANEELRFGLYYIAKTAYFNIGGEKFYTEEINATEIGKLIAVPFMSSDLDLTSIITGFLTGNMGIDEVDMILQFIPLFDRVTDGATKKIVTKGPSTDTVDYQFVLRIDAIVSALPLIGTVLSWESLDLPNLDPLLDKILGITLDGILTRKWPRMESQMTFSTNFSDKIPITDEAGDIVYDEQGERMFKPGYYFNGFKVDLATTVQPREYELHFVTVPFRLGAGDEKNPITFPSRYNLGDAYKDSEYTKASLFNLELQATLAVDADDNGQLTLNNVLGSFADLGAVGDIPLNFPAQATSYAFTINAKVHIDIFNYNETKLELTLFFQNEPFIQVYFEGDVLYINCSELSDINGQIIPNIKIPDFNINEMLSSTLEDLMPYLDPDYVALLSGENAEHLANAEDDDDDEDDMDMMLIVEIIANNITESYNENGDKIMGIFLDNVAINSLLAMFMGEGSSVGIPGIMLSANTSDFLNTMMAKIELTDTVSARLSIDKIGYFKEPEFVNKEMIANPVDEATYIDIKNALMRYYGITLSGEFEMGMNKTEGGISFDGLMSALLGDIMLNLGITESSSTRVGYLLKAGLDFSDVSNSGMSINFYLADTGNGTDDVFLVLYYEAAEDVMYLDLSHFWRLKEAMPALKVLGDLPKLKIENVGIRDSLPTIDFFNSEDSNAPRNMALAGEGGYTITTPQNLMADIFSGLFIGAGFAYNAAAEEGDEDEDGIDVMDILAQAISINVVDEIKALVISLDKSVLTMLMGMMNVVAPMPELEAYLKLQLIGVGTLGENTGYLQAYFAILDSLPDENGDYLHALYVDIQLVRKIQMTISDRRPEYFIESFNPTEFVPVDIFLENLVIGLELAGGFNLKSDSPSYTNSYIDEMLAGLIEGLSLRFGLDGFEMDLGYELKANITYADIMALSSDEPPAELSSQLSLVLIDRSENMEIFGLYILDNNIYIDLSYFGMPNIRLDNSASLIANIMGLLDEAEEQENSDIPPSPAYSSPLNSLNGGLDDKVRLQVLIAPDKVSLMLTQATMAGLLALFMDGDLPVTIRDTEINIGLSDGITLEFSTGIEVFTMHAELARFFITIAGDQLPNIVLPSKEFYGNSDGMPKYVYVSAEGEFSLQAEPDNVDGRLVNKYIDLTPAMRELFGSVELNAYLEMLGFVDGNLYFKLEAAINIDDPVDSSIKLLLSSGSSGNPADRTTVMEVLYNQGDLYINTNAFGLGKIYVKDVDNVFTQLSEASEAQKQNQGSAPANAETDAANYIELMFVKGGLTVYIVKDVLLALFGALGADMTPYLGGIDELVIEAGIGINPIDFSLGFTADGISLGFGLRNIVLAFDREIELPDTSDYTTIEELTTISVSLNGEFTFEVSGSEEDRRFDYIIDEIKALLSADAGGSIDFESMLNFGILLQVIGEKFGGTIYYNIDAHIDLLNTDNLNLSLMLSSLSVYNNYLQTGDKTELGDIISLFIASENGVLNAYLDAESLGLEKIKIRDVSNIGDIFDSDGDSPLELPANSSGTVSAADVLAAHILISITSNPENQYNGANAPILISLTQGAFFALFNSMGLDISRFVGPYSPSAEVVLGESQEFIALKFNLKDLLAIKATIENPVLEINGNTDMFRDLAEDDSYYLINADDDKLMLRIALAGSFVFNAEDTDDDSAVDLSNIIRTFLTEANFGILLENAGYAGKTIKYDIQIKANLRKVISGGDKGLAEGLEALILFTVLDSPDAQTGQDFSLYLKGGDLFADLGILNAGKVRINDVLGVFESENISSQTVQAASVLNSEFYNLGEQLAAAYITLQLGNTSGIILSAFTDVFVVIMNAFSLPEGDIELVGMQLGDLVADTLNNNMLLEIGIGTGSVFEINIEVANYDLSFAFSSIELFFRSSDIIFWDFREGDYGLIDTELDEIYLNFSFYFGWEFNDGAEYSLAKLFESLTLAEGLKVEPVIAVLNEIGQRFKIDIEAVLNLENLLDDDLETTEQAEGSHLSIVMYNVTGDKHEYVLSIYFVDGDLYLDAECFNIQQVKIVNAVEYFYMIRAMLDEVSANNPSENAPSNAEGAPKSAELNAMAAYINLMVCPEGFIASIGSTALFAVLQMMGMDYSHYIEPVGVIDIKATLFSPSSIIELSLGLISYEFDVAGERIIEGYNQEGRPIYKTDGKQMRFFMEFSNSYRIAFKIGENEKIDTPAATDSRVEIDNQVPVLGISTKIFFEASAKEATFPNLNQEPLSSLITTLLEGFTDDPEGDPAMIEYIKRLVITIFFQISGEQTARFELDILINVNVVNTDAIEAQIMVNKMDGDVPNRIMQFNLYNGDVFVDLKPIGGPQLCIEGVFDPYDDRGNNTEPNNQPQNSQPANDEDDFDNVKPFSLTAAITEQGLFLYAYKASFNALLNMLNMQDIAMFDFMELQAYAKPINQSLTLGLEFKIGTETQQDVIKVGFGIEGLRLNFVPFSREQLINPGSSRYVNDDDIDTVIAESRFELTFQSEKGNIQLSDLYFAIFGDSPLTTTLPQRLDLETLGDTLVIDIKAIVNIENFDDLIDNLQLKVHLFSKKAPEKFTLEVIYYKNSIYIDASKIGLSKIVLEDITGLIEFFSGDDEDEDEDAPSGLARYVERVREIESITAPSNEEQQEHLAAMLSILLSADEGLFITAAKDLLFVVFNIIGMDIQSHMDNVVNPQIKFGINPELSLEIDIQLKSALADNLGALGVKMAFITNKISIDVADEALFQTPDGIESSITPIISKEERALYTNYDKLTLYSEINMGLTVNLKDGRISADSALGALFKLLDIDAELATDVVFTGGNERMEVDIKGAIGINFERLLSRDPELIKKATSATLELSYAIYDGNGDLYHAQPLANLYLTDDIIYLTLELMDSHVNIRIPDANLSTMFTDLFGVTPGTEDEPENEPQAAETPIDGIYAGIKNLGRGVPDKETLEAVINLNSKGFSLVITKELLIALMGELTGLMGASAEDEDDFDLSTIDFEAVFGDILDGASMGFYVDGEDGGFSLRFNLFKYQEDVEGDAGASYPSAGYNIELSLLHDTLISTDPNKYADFDNYLRNDPDLKAMYESCMDSRDVSWRFTVGIDLVLGADFLPYVLDWSELFGLEEEESAFYLQVLEQLRGKTTMSLTIDVLSTGLENLMMDIMVRFTNEAGDEVMALYFVGNLSQINALEKEADEDYDFSKVVTNPQLYLTVPGMGIEGLVLNSESFEMFLGLNINEMLTSLAMGEGGSFAPQPANAPQNDEGEEEDDDIIVDNEGLDADWWAKILDSIEFSKGQIGIVIAKTVVQDLLYYMAGIPFDNLGKISFVMDNKANLLRFDFSLDNQPEIDMTKINIGVLDEMEFIGKQWPTEQLTSIDMEFPKLEAGNVIGAYSFVDSFEREAYYVLLAGITPEDLEAFNGMIGNYTQLTPDTSHEGVTLYHFYEIDNINAVGLIALYDNGLLTLILAKDEEFNETRLYSLNSVEIGTLSQMQPLSAEWADDEISNLDALLPMFEGEILYSFIYYDKEYKRDAVYMLFDNVTQETMRAYVDHIRAAGYQMNKDSNGTYHLSKNSLRFSDEGEEKIDVIASVKLYENGTMAVAISDTTNKYNINFALQNINVILGKNDIFAAHFEPQGIDYGTYFGTFKPLHEYKWEFEVYSELTIDDSVGGLFNLTELAGSLLGSSMMNVALQPSEDINIVVGFRLRVFIDFSDLARLRLQLSITYNGKEMVLITYVGNIVDDKEESVIYADLSGLSFPAIELKGIQLGGMVKEMMNSMDFSDDSSSSAPSDAPQNAPQNAEGTLLNNEGRENTLPLSEIINIKDISFGSRLLLFTASSKEVSLAITGALAYSLIAGMEGNDDFLLPMFRNLKVGYSEEEGLAGLVLRITDDTPYEQAFRIGFNFRSSYSKFSTTLVSSIDPTRNAAGEIIPYEDISKLSQIGLALDLEMRLRAKKNAGPDGMPQKSDQIKMLESLIENLVGIEKGGVNLEPQDSVLVFGVQFRLFIDLANLSNTTLLISLTFNEEPFLAIYYFAEKNLVYADLNGLGLFRAAINGVDLMSMIGYMLSDTIDPGIGIDLSKMIGLSASEAAQGMSSAEDAINGPQNTEQVFADDLRAASDAPLIRILLGNDEITFNPNGALFASLMSDMALPNFADIRLSSNISYGLNNMSFRIKMDNLGNNISFNIAENMFRFAIGEAAGHSQFRIPISLVSDDKFGAISGITLNADSEGDMVTNMDTVALASTLLDTLKLSNLTIYLDKRNDYWYMRDLRWGIPEFATGPNYWGHPGVGTGLGGGAGYDVKVDAISFDLFGYDISFGTTFDPLYFNNSFRRLRLSLNKTTSNALNIRLEQLTQVLGVTTTYSDTSDWRPMTATAFISDNILKLSLASALVIDLTPIIETIVELILDAILQAVLPGLGGVVSGLISDLVAQIAAPFISELLGDLTGYGNPLRLGQIIDDVMDGGIEVYRVFLPEMLADDDDDEDPFAYGSLYGRITDDDGNGIPNAIVYLDGNVRYNTRTDKDGYYTFVNVKANTYQFSIKADGYNDKPLAGDPKINITVRSYITHPAQRYDEVLYDYQIEVFNNITIEGTITNEDGQPSGNTRIYLDDTQFATTDATGWYSYTFEQITGRSHTLTTNTGLSKSITITRHNEVVNGSMEGKRPTTGTITGTLVVLEDVDLIKGNNLTQITGSLRAATHEDDITEWNLYTNSLDPSILSLSNENITRYTEVVNNVRFAIYNDIGTTEYATYRDELGFRGYALEQNGNVYHALNTSKSVIVETRHFPSVDTLVVAIKKAENIAVNSDLEIWLERAGRTVRESDSHNGVSINARLSDETYYDNDDDEDRALAVITPRNYLKNANEQGQSNINATGYFEIRDLAFSQNYILKIRSEKYLYQNISVPVMQSNAAIARVGTIILIARPEHWSGQEEAAASMIQSLRIRLGADILDANGSGTTTDPTNPGYANDGLPQTLYSWATDLGEGVMNDILGAIPYVGGFLGGLLGGGNDPYIDEKGKPIFMPETNYIDGYEGGAYDRSNNISYVEVWLNSDVITGLFDSLNGFLMPMIGLSAITEDQRYSIADLAVPPAGASDTDIFQYIGTFDESRDEQVFNYVYSNKSQYLRAIKGASAKLPAGLISYLINDAIREVEFLQNEYVRMVIQYAAGALIDEQLDQVTRLISHIMPFTYPYSMAYEKDLPNSPLQQTAVTSTKDANLTTNVQELMENDGILVNGVRTVTNLYATTPQTDDNGHLLNGYMRETDFFDMAAYLKLFFNANSDTIVDRIVLFINGASYAASNTQGIIAGNGTDWKPNGTALRADTIRYDEETGLPHPDDLEMAQVIENWIRKNIVNSYVVVSDYSYTTDEFGVTKKTLIGKTYVRDVHGHFDLDDWEYGYNTLAGDPDKQTAAGILSAKDDHYHEIDINNTGIRLRVVRSLASGNKFFFATDTGDGPIQRTTMEPPEKIIFHDPYNTKDFTVHGGTWALAGSMGVRHNLNSDGTYSVNSILDILPNRNEALFYDGNSSESTGVHMYWDMTSVNFAPTDSDTKSYIIGYCANAVYGKTANGLITRIETIVEGKMIVDPTSTLHLNKAGDAVDTQTTTPVLNLDPIDPFDFDRDAYIANLPATFAYAYKMQYVVDGVAQPFFVYGDETDYIYKRYVFDDLEWDMSETELHYSGKTAYIKLSYGTSENLGVNQREKITIQVPIEVKNRTVQSVSAPVENSVGGIINDRIIFNPLMHTGLKDTMLSVDMLTLHTPAGDELREVVAVDAEGLNAYDPKAIEHPEYTVSYWIEDDFGVRQKRDVTVEILSRKIETSSLDEFGDKLENGVRMQEIVPFQNSGLGLPQSITVVYAGVAGGVPLSETLYEGPDYEWIIPSMSYNHNSSEPYKVYDIIARIGTGDYMQEVIVKYKVMQKIPKTVVGIFVPPYGDTSISNSQMVVFNNGSADEAAVSTEVHFSLNEHTTVDPFEWAESESYNGVSYKQDIRFIDPSFKGKFYYTDVLLSDEYFGKAVVKNVSITVRMSQIININPPLGETIKINQYYSDSEIDALFNMSGLTADIFGTSVKSSDDFFEIIDWNYQGEAGLPVNGKNAFVEVRVGNKGYDNNPVWIQEVLLDMSSYLEDLTVESLVSDIVVIDDPYQYTLPTTVEVIYKKSGVTATNILPAVYDLGELADDFYKYPSIIGTVAIGHENAQEVFEVEFINKDPRAVASITYYNDAAGTEVFEVGEAVTFFAFDQINLPQYAKVEFAGNEPPEAKMFNVYWYSIDEYGTEGGLVTAEAWIGDPVFGYIKDKQDFKFTVIGETITGFYNEETDEYIDVEEFIPDFILLHPYESITDQIGARVPTTLVVSTDKRQGVTVEVRYPEIPLSYDGQHEHRLNFEIGLTNNFGNVGNIRTGQTENFSYEIRESFATRFIVDDRLATGISLEANGENLTLEGSIYERIDFTQLEELYVLFRNGAREPMTVVWEAEELEKIKYTFLGGAVYINATIGKGIEGLEQKFPVRVFIRPSRLVDVVALEGDIDTPILVLDNDDLQNRIAELRVDPFEGFVGLPERVLAKFENEDKMAEVYVSWSYQRIVDTMTLEGQRFDIGNNLAAIATIFDYVEEDDGNGGVVRTRTALQSLEIPVETITRTIEATEVSRTTDGDDFEQLRTEFSINPYAAQYSENFDSEDFSYFRRVRLTVKDGEGSKTLVFDLNKDSYLIRDALTGRNTNLHNLHTGRNVTVALSYGKRGGSVSKNAFVSQNLYVNILDMRYESGLKDAYYIDVYGAKVDPVNYPEYSQKVEYQDGEVLLNTVSDTPYTFDVVYNAEDINTNFDRFDNKTGPIGYNAGTGRLYAIFGNDYAGYQEVIIPIYYEERTITSLFDTEENPYFDYFTTTSGIERQGFIFDPFAEYSIENNYPQLSDVIRFNTSDGITASFDNNSQASKVKVVWDDKNVKITYRGSEDGYVRATVSAADGSAPQTILYRVKIMNRTVVDYTNVLLTDDYVIKGYDFNNTPDLAAEVAKKIFKPAGTVFTVFFAEGKEINFPLGGTAEYFMTEDDVLLTSEETELSLSFAIDTSRPINYKGRDARFFVRIPGFGMGAAGQQLASYDVACEEQYILDVEFYNETLDTYQDYFTWLQAVEPYAHLLPENGGGGVSQNMGAVQAGNNFVFDIANPYFFIKRNGVPLSDKVKIHVGTAEGEITHYYPNPDVPSDIETYWSSSRNNRANIYYNRDIINSSFQMDLDNQSFRMTFNVTPWVLENDLMFFENYAYGMSEIILLPDQSKVNSGAPISVRGLANPNDTYEINFGGGKIETFDPINGGGSYISNYNKWSFDDVNFFSLDPQYAKLTLGGRGGQEIQWRFFTSEKQLVNNTIPAVYTLRRGESVDLPTQFRQLFSGSTYENSKSYGIQYANLYSTEETRGHGFGQNGLRITGTTLTPSRTVTEGSSYPRGIDNAAPAYIDWTAAPVRAYPSTYEQVGGRIYFVCYDTPNWNDSDEYGYMNNLATHNSYLHNPDASYAYGTIRPGMDMNWQYPADLSISGSATMGGNTYMTPINSYSHNVSFGGKQSAVPVIQVNQNTLFTNLNLPMVSLTYYRREVAEGWGGWGSGRVGVTADQIYTIPWEKAQVYWTAHPRIQEYWNHNTDLYGTRINNNNAIPDIYFINTGKDQQGNSREGGRYTLVVPMRFNNSQFGQADVVYNMVVALDIVDFIF